MVPDDPLDILRRGVEEWNRWRRTSDGGSGRIDLSNVDLAGADLSGVDFHEVDLRGCGFSKTTLSRADLAGAQLDGVDLTAVQLGDADLSGASMRRSLLNLTRLTGADLSRADLTASSMFRAELSHATLQGATLDDAACTSANLERSDLAQASLQRANLHGSDLTAARLDGANCVGANLSSCRLTSASLAGADLRNASVVRSVLVETSLEGADLNGAHVYGVAVWDIVGEPASQLELAITRTHPTAWNLHSPSETRPALTVDNIQVAQFIHMLLNDAALRDVIDTLSSKIVLILGRFTTERKRVLDALRTELRSRNLTPILFDFEIPAERDVSETVGLLARMARFVIADLTDPASIPMELQLIAPDVSVPIVTIVHEGQEPFSMFRDLLKYPWVIPPVEYADPEALLSNVSDLVIAPAEQRRSQLARG